MSLNVYLYGQERTNECVCFNCGNTHKTTQKELLFTKNITHNLTDMATKAGIYLHCWRPEELGKTTAKELITVLEEGLKRLKEKPEYYKRYNPSNGWGTYEYLVDFVKSYLDACIKYPEAKIETDR